MVLRLSSFPTDVTSVLGGSVTTTTTQAAAYTLQQSDNNTVILVNSTAAVTITLPSTLTVGTAVEIIQTGVGQVTFAAGASATVAAYGSATKTAGQNAVARVRVTAASTWNLAGNVV